MKYQIIDWNLHFENNRSRNIERCSFVCVPNKQHGMGFSRIMAEPDGSAIYGIWHCIVGACSQQVNRGGWLTSDGHQTGTAWAPDDLALKFRRPVQEIVRALDFLSSEKVCWIRACKDADAQVTPKCIPSDAQVPSRGEQVTPKGVEEKEGIEGKKEERESSEPTRQTAAPKPKDASLPLISEIFDCWNESSKSTGLPQCLLLSDKRKIALKARLGEQFFRVNWRKAMEAVGASKFCRGDNNRGWRASFDWFISRDVVAKILEGKYDGEPFSPTQTTQKPQKLTEAQLLEAAL